MEVVLISKVVGLLLLEDLAQIIMLVRTQNQIIVEEMKNGNIIKVDSNGSSKNYDVQN